MTDLYRKWAIINLPANCSDVDHNRHLVHRKARQDQMPVVKIPLSGGFIL